MTISPGAAAPRAWQRMLSGRRLSLFDPSPDDIAIEDIAHGLARVARWNGQTHGPHIFSVAQHSLLVEAIAAALQPGLPREARLVMLLHDAPEYVVGDVISPLKAAIGSAYKEIELRLLAAIHRRFGLPPDADAAWAGLAKQADRSAAFLEAVDLAGFAGEEAEALFGRPAVSPALFAALLQPWPAEAAEARLHARLVSLVSTDTEDGGPGAEKSCQGGFESP